MLLAIMVCAATVRPSGDFRAAARARRPVGTPGRLAGPPGQVVRPMPVTRWSAPPNRLTQRCRHAALLLGAHDGAWVPHGGAGGQLVVEASGSWPPGS